MVNCTKQNLVMFNGKNIPSKNHQGLVHVSYALQGIDTEPKTANQTVLETDNKIKH